MHQVLLVLFGAVTLAHMAPIEYYSSKYEHLDVDTIINNRRMVNYYASCMLSQGPCNPQGLEVKKILPEAIHDNCARCTEKHKAVAYRAMKRLRKEYPKIWDQMVAMWDPDQSYVTRFFATFERPTAAPSTSTPTIVNRFDDSDATTVPKGTTTTPIPSTTSHAPNTTAPAPTTVAVTTRVPPRRTVSADIQATVSFGTNLVGGIVRGLGNLGTKVVQTGTKLANAVISVVVH